jgi:hypothetical protein
MRTTQKTKVMQISDFAGYFSLRAAYIHCLSDRTVCAAWTWIAFLPFFSFSPPSAYLRLNITLFFAPFFVENYSQA